MNWFQNLRAGRDLTVWVQERLKDPASAIVAIVAMFLAALVLKPGVENKPQPGPSSMDKSFVGAPDSPPGKVILTDPPVPRDGAAIRILHVTIEGDQIEVHGAVETAGTGGLPNDFEVTVGLGDAPPAQASASVDPEKRWTASLKPDRLPSAGEMVHVHAELRQGQNLISKIDGQYKVE